MLKTFIRSEAQQFLQKVVLQRDRATYISSPCLYHLGWNFPEFMNGKIWSITSASKITWPSLIGVLLLVILKHQVYWDSRPILLHRKQKFTTAVKTVNSRIINQAWIGLVNRLHTNIRELGGHIKHQWSSAILLNLIFTAAQSKMSYILCA